ncbi:hypothetical protein DTO282F9_7778 [Paecilomyces variotii]|nr:hypothetical protein DTO282F9_7778 [Paecilomyces variotii]
MNNNNNNNNTAMDNIVVNLPVRVKGAAEGQQPQPQQPQGNPSRPPEPLTGEMSKTQSKKRRREEAVRKRILAEFASKGIVLPPEEDTDEMQLEPPAKILTRGQQIRKEELLEDLKELKGIRKQLQDEIRSLKKSQEEIAKALADKEEKLRGLYDRFTAVTSELRPLR